MSSTCPQNMANFGSLTAKNGYRICRHSSKFQRLSRLAFVTAATSLNGNQPNFARCLAVSWAGILYIHFGGALAPNGILPGAKFTLHPSLAFFCFDSVTARHFSSGHQPNFAAWYKEWNYWTFATCIRQGGHHVGHRPHSSWDDKHLFNDVESLSASLQIVLVINVAGVPSKRMFVGGVSLRPVAEENVVAVGHVAVLGAEQKARHDRGLCVTVHDHCAVYTARRGFARG